MNANFKGVAIILSDKSADDIWDKIGLIDDKDAEQDRKDEEQDEAIAGKLDKDDGMGLVDEKLGGIDRAIEELSEETGEEIGSIEETIETLEETIETLSGKLDDVIANAYAYKEDLLWEGSYNPEGDPIWVEEYVNEYDYIYFYNNDGLSIFMKSEDIDNYEFYLQYVKTYKNNIYIEIENAKLKFTGRVLNYVESYTWSWGGGAVEDADLVSPSTYTFLNKIIGIKMVPLSDIINTGE